MRNDFKYLRPTSVPEAVRMKARYGEQAAYWAGGTDLVLDWTRGLVTPDCCIDLTALDGLGGIEVGDGRASIGAMTTLYELERATDPPLLAFLADVARVMCTPQTRSIATVGGNICHASPSADLAAPLLALDAQARVAGSGGERTLALTELFAGVQRTTLAADELLLDVGFAVPANRRAAFARVSRTVVDIALVIVAAALDVGVDGRIEAARIALGSVAPVPLRARAAEDLLVGAAASDLPAELLDEVGRAAAAAASPISDMRASRAYREEISRVLTRRAIAQAAAQPRLEGAPA